MQQPTAWLAVGVVGMTNTTVCSVLLYIYRPPELPCVSAPPSISRQLGLDRGHDCSLFIAFSLVPTTAAQKASASPICRGKEDYFVLFVF